MSSLRYRGVVSGWDELGSTPAEGSSGLDYRTIARDPAVDQTTPQGFRSVGLAGNPDPPVVLGPQTSHLNDGTGERRSKQGRPTCWKTSVFRPRERDLNREGPGSQKDGAGERGTLVPVNVRRNVQYAKNGIPAPGFFSWAANVLGWAFGFEPARPPQDEYLVSSHFLGIADSLATVVSGTTKPAPGLEPFRGGATVQAGASTGWPVIAPQIPSYGSRVPLRRPRGLVAIDQ